MIIWALISLTVLVDIPILAKVVNDFRECDDFFYKKTPPQGMDQNSKKICQQYDYGGSYYATLYSTFHRIPVYSAYTFDCDGNREGAQKIWLIEPGLAGLQGEEMKSEKSYRNQNDRNKIKHSQALNADYSHTGYDRGHLNPNSFQCNDGRKATFTLTNAAPMDACFNRVHWKQWEDGVKKIIKEQSGSGTAYLVTGTVPSRNPNYRIPRRGELDDPEEHSTEDYERVTVPTHVWTAVCYEHFIDEQSFSFGFIGDNKPNTNIEIMTVPDLNNVLTGLYGTTIKIFIDDCFSKKPKSEKILKYLYMSIQLPLGDKLDIPHDILNKIYSASSQTDNIVGQPSKRPKIVEMKVLQYFDNSFTWFKKTERMKKVSGLTCEQSQQFTGPVKRSSTGIQKRSTLNPHFVCSLVPEQVSGCSSSCLYRKEAGGYYCYSGDTEQPCSPRYSVITLSGAKCASGHTCAKKGKSYGCYINSEVWQHCSPPLPLGKTNGKYCRSNHNCGWYFEDYTWCYTDYEDNWDYCCNTEDPFSARNGRTCKPDHLCDYHGESYLWCYTTDNSWDYCCTPSDPSSSAVIHDELKA